MSVHNVDNKPGNRTSRCSHAGHNDEGGGTWSSHLKATGPISLPSPTACWEARWMLDIVQETYLRYSTTPPETITSLKAFLTTVLTRLCMDQLHLARRKREVYPGPWLPEPIITTTTLES